MIKPKKKRKGASAQVAFSALQDIIRMSNEPRKAPRAKKQKKKR
jgi:hypothetical protein